MNGKQTDPTLEQYTSRLTQAKQRQREMTNEPGTVSHAIGLEVTTTALEDDPVDQIENLLGNAEVSRIEPCFDNISTAVQVAEVVVAHPGTITTKVRIHYVDKNEIQRLPLLEMAGSRQQQLKAALAQFISAFTVDAEGESLTKNELFDTFRRWHENLTGRSVSMPWFGRVLRALDTEKIGQITSDRKWGGSLKI